MANNKTINSDQLQLALNKFKEKSDEIYVNKNSGAIPTISIALNQVTSQDPITIQLTNEQYNIFVNNKQVIVDASALGIDVSIIWNYTNETVNKLLFTAQIAVGDLTYMLIEIDKSTYIGEFFNMSKEVYPNNIVADSANAGLLLGVANNGVATPTNNLPYITTAPVADNTEGGIKIVVLTSEPATYYSGYYYIITEP